MRLHVEAERKKFQEDQRFKAFLEEERKNSCRGKAESRSRTVRRKGRRQLRRRGRRQLRRKGKRQLLQLRQRSRKQEQRGPKRKGGGLRRKEERREGEREESGKGCKPAKSGIR